MEKFQGCNVNRHTANAGENAEVINAHSEAIEALQERVSEHDSRVFRVLFGHEEPAPLHWDRTMTADEAVAIVVLEFMGAMTGYMHTDARLEQIRGRIISALRDHGREDR